uniref:UFSP1/2/DUB catalytic domain-containing protein n=1 Tax=Arcella intermedia TaxID=1963864 RepID=A0A6B2L9M3_9EUKA
MPRRPLLRIVSALTFSPTPTRSARLSDVHLNIPPPAKGKEYLVQGSYDYYHYNQDSFNDDGWGCAYRSLQTIQSWYQKANLTTQPIQNHLEIQKFLYALGQKPKNFVGSKEWIGSIEIQTILRGYMGIVSKIEHVQKGNQMADHVSVLIDHFERQGTPIMIGGGQLAYTLLGVHVNQDTGRVMYLILDPHYVGKEDLQVIHKKGWCGWKDGSLFKDKYFYNLCLPQAHNPSASGV